MWHNIESYGKIINENDLDQGGLWDVYGELSWLLLTNIERLSLLQAAPFHELDPKLYKSEEN